MNQPSPNYNARSSWDFTHLSFIRIHNISQYSCLPSQDKRHAETHTKTLPLESRRKFERLLSLQSPSQSLISQTRTHKEQLVVEKWRFQSG